MYAILEDKDQVLWMSTNQGVSSDPRTETFVQYDKEDGLPSLGFYDFSALKASDGTFTSVLLKGWLEVLSRSRS